MIMSVNSVGLSGSGAVEGLQEKEDASQRDVEDDSHGYHEVVSR
jgi:hypothetical protein